MTNTRNQKQNLLFLTLNAIFIAIILIFNFTPLGFLKVGLIEVSLIVIPVAIGSVMLGAKSGFLLGTTFGILSFIQCFGMSAFGVALMQINPMFTFIVCLVPRMLMGTVSGSLFKVLEKTKLPKPIASAISCFACALVNTIGFVGLFVLFFSRTEFFAGLESSLGTDNIIAFVAAFVGINGALESVVSAVVGVSLQPLFKKLPMLK